MQLSVRKYRDRTDCGTPTQTMYQTLAMQQTIKQERRHNRITWFGSMNLRPRGEDGNYIDHGFGTDTRHTHESRNELHTIINTSQHSSNPINENSIKIIATHILNFGMPRYIKIYMLLYQNLSLKYQLYRK